MVVDSESESSRERLLRKKEKYPNCPGCKVELYKESNQGYPTKDLLRILIIVLTNALPISSLYPFLYFMIRDLKVAKIEEDIGFYAGYVGSSLMVGRALTSILWGTLADRYGRKPIIIVGTLAVVIFNCLFGLSVNYWMAISTRFLLGSLNGILGPTKAYAAEIFREEYQALGMSAVNIGWGAGLVLGPAIGGFLAQPADKYPNIFSKDSLFGRFPYFLPCFCISFFAVVSMVLSFWLPESLHSHNEEKGDVDEAIESGQNNEQRAKPSILRNWPLISSIIVFCVFSLHDMAFSEIVSLFAVSPRKLGGLSFSTDTIGEVLAITGSSLFLFQIFLYPYLAKLFGTLLVCQLAGALTIPLLTGYPYMVLLSGTPLFVVITLATVIKSFLAVSIGTSLAILQNRAVDQDQRGAANGLSTTAMSLFNAVGPATGGAIFSWAEKRDGASILPGSQILFFLLNVVEAIGVLLTFKPFLAIRE